MRVARSYRGSFTGAEHPDAQARRLRGREADEVARRAFGVVGAGKPTRQGERPPVDRYCDARLDHLSGRHGTLGIEVPGAEAPSPAPDREQGEVDAAVESGHAREKIGVAGEVD